MDRLPSMSNGGAGGGGGASRGGAGGGGVSGGGQGRGGTGTGSVSTASSIRELTPVFEEAEGRGIPVSTVIDTVIRFRSQGMPEGDIPAAALSRLREQYPVPSGAPGGGAPGGGAIYG
jgi:hypothetical protein